MSARIRNASLSCYIVLATSLQLPAQRMLRAAGIDPHSLENPELAEIAELLGFSALSAVSRWIRKQFGASVTDWRKMHR